MTTPTLPRQARTLPVSRVFETVTLIAFVGALVAPTIAGILGRSDDSVAVENRRPVPPPVLAWDAAAWRAFPDAADAFVADRIGFRHDLIRWHNAAELRWLGTSSIATTMPGKDGWLFFTGDESLETMRGFRPFSARQLGHWRCLLEARRDWLAARGVPYVFVIAPDKQTVYPDRLPDYARRAGARTRYQQLYDYMAEHSDVTMVDLRPALAAARRDRLVYYPLGTHWNAIGARVAYGALITATRRWLPELTARPSDATSFVTVDERGDSLGSGLHLDGVLRQPVFALSTSEPPRWHELPSSFIRLRRTTEQSGATGPRAVVFHDSFADAWMPDLSNDFARVHYVRQRDFDFGIVASERPDVVIHEMVERYLIYEPSNGAVEVGWNVEWNGRAAGVARPHDAGNAVAARCF